MEDVGLILEAQCIRLRRGNGRNVRFGLNLQKITIRGLATISFTPSPLIKLFTPLILFSVFLTRFIDLMKVLGLD